MTQQDMPTFDQPQNLPQDPQPPKKPRPKPTRKPKASKVRAAAPVPKRRRTTKRRKSIMIPTPKNPLGRLPEMFDACRRIGDILGEFTPAESKAIMASMEQAVHKP